MIYFRRETKRIIYKSVVSEIAPSTTKTKQLPEAQGIATLKK